MKKKLKLFILIGAAVLAAGLGAVSALSPLAVDVRVIHPETATLTFTEQGAYDYEERRLVYPIVSGEVLEVLVREGDAVAAGDVLAVVDAGDYEYQIAQLRSAIDGYNGQLNNLSLTERKEKDSLSASLEDLKGKLTSLEAEMEKNKEGDESLEAQIGIQEAIVFHNRNNVAIARENLRDARDLGDDQMVNEARQAYNLAENTLSQSEITLEQLRTGNVPQDVYEGQKQSLQAQIGSVASQLEKSYSGGMRQYYTAQIQAAEAGIAQMEEQAGRAEITAPIAGVVSELPVKEQNLISQQAYAAAIGSGGRVEVFVPIREIDGVAVGDKVELLLDKRLGKETIAGTVTHVDGEAQIKLSALGVEERKVRVLISPDEPKLAIGYDMDVRFTVYTVENALIVPKTAVFQLDGGDCVWVVRDGVLAVQAVEKGIETRDGYIVEAGLSDGDVVVADADNSSLQEGKRAEG